MFGRSGGSPPGVELSSIQDATREKTILLEETECSIHSNLRVPKEEPLEVLM
jgi:hypothetical protein